MESNSRAPIFILGIVLISLIWIYLLWTMSFWEVTRDIIRLIVFSGTIISPFFGIASFIFFLPLVPETYETIDLGHGIPDLTWQRLLVLILIVSILLNITVRRKLQDRATIQLSKFDQVVLLYAVVILSSVFYSTDIPNNIEKYLVVIFIPLLMYFFIRMFVTNWKRIRILLTTILGSSILISLVMIIQGVTGKPP